MYRTKNIKYKYKHTIKKELNYLKVKCFKYFTLRFCLKSLRLYAIEIDFICKRSMYIYTIYFTFKYLKFHCYISDFSKQKTFILKLLYLCLNTNYILYIYC